MDFTYFAGPEEDMAGYAGVRSCSLCKADGPTFSLDFAIVEGKQQSWDTRGLGCYDCLRSGHFEFWHDTDIGLLDETGLAHVYRHNGTPPSGFPSSALVELRRTPQIVTWQQELWLTHCCDFMVYIGTWEPSDFYANAPDGDGRALFLRMTTEAHYPNLWDDVALEDGGRLEAWHATYYVFRCLHCHALAGDWDCD